MFARARRGCREIVFGAIVLVSCGCASTVAGPGDRSGGMPGEPSGVLSGDPMDPWESTNRGFYAFNDALDKAVLEPVASIYLKLPRGLRNTIHNFFDNAEYPGTVLNQLLQGKIERALEDSARFVFNSTLGIGGLFDVSTDFGLPRHDEDFGQTLAVWGLSEGNYIHYPLLGPSTVRDTPGIVVGMLTDALTYAAVLPLALLEVVDQRATLASAARLRDQSALDPYVFTREAYRQRRAFLIRDGSLLLNDFGDFDEDDEESWDEAADA